VDQIPHGLSVALGTLPFLGAGLLVMIVAALAADRDRWIIPGTVAALVLVAGLSAAMEFGPQMQSAIASRMEQASEPAPAPEPGPEEPAVEEPAGADTEPAEPTEDSPSPAQPQPTSPAPSQPVPAGYVPGDLVPMPDGRQGVVVIDRNTGRRTVVVNPNASQPAGQRPTATVPAQTQPVQPATRPTAPVALPPAAQPAAPAVAVNTQPPRTVVPTSPTRPPELPTLPSSPGTSPVGGVGTLVVKINGPLVEDAEEGTDVHAIRKGNISITPITLDCTSYKACENTKTIFS